MEIYVCVTLYHLYLSLLIINERNSKTNTILLLNANDEYIYDEFCSFKSKLEKQGYFIDCRLRNKIKDIIGIEEIKSYKQYKKINKLKGYKLSKGFDLYNFAWNCDYVYTNANFFYKKCSKAYFIEEGALTAFNSPQPRIKKVIKKLMFGSINFYKDKKVIGIYVQDLDIYPIKWKDKIKFLDIKKLVSNLNDQNKFDLIHMFLDSTIKNSNYDACGIIYTQPLSEDGFISEKKKIRYFDEMVSYYSKYGNVIVKLHPRDTSLYTFSNEVKILSRSFPSELFLILDIKFMFAVGICTSAIKTTNAVYKLNINENFLNNLKFDLVPLNINERGKI